MLQNLPDLLLEKIFDVLDFQSQVRLSQTTSNIRSRQIRSKEIWTNGISAIYGKNWKTFFALILEVNGIDFADIRSGLTSNLCEDEIDLIYDETIIFSFLRHGFGSFEGLRKYEPIAAGFASAFATLQGLWMEKIIANGATETIRTALSLQSGCSEGDLNELENEIREMTEEQDWTLPLEFRLLYRVFNGQPLGMIDERNVQPLFGKVTVYDTIIAPYLLQLDSIRKLIGVQHGRSESDFLGKGYLPIAVSSFRVQGRLIQYYCDTNSGKIFTPRRDVRRDEFKGAFVISKSVQAFLELAVNIIQETVNRINDGEEVDTISGFREAVSQKQDDFTVTVRKTCLYHESGVNPASFHYAYEISQSMDKGADTSKSMKLQRRYWKIDDLLGDVDEVDGPGVIGQYPILRPGSRHTYASRTSFRVPKGEMSGFFTYQKLHEGKGPLHKMLKVPLFELNAPEVDEQIGTSGDD